MNRYRLAKAGVDVSDGLRRFGGSQELFEKFLMKFPTNAAYRELLNALETGDVEAGFQAGHALKGVAGNLSLEKLYQALLPLVEELRAGSLAWVEELLPPVKAAYEAVVAALTDNA